MKLRRDCGLVIAAFVLATPSAFAQQTEDEELQTVLITGSRIARPELDRLQPTVSVTADELDERGITNIVDALGELPSFGLADSSNVGLQPSSFGVAQSFADFLSLGSQRTLTLVNGHRFVSSNTSSIFGPADPGQQVDLNAIPTKLIERVDVIAVGGAPIYGSDAIAGTVNVILKRNYQGFEVDALTGITEEGDAFNWRVRALGGVNFADGRGNIVANAEFSTADGLLYTDRELTRRGLFFTTPDDPDYPFDQKLYENRRISVVNKGGLPLVDDFIVQFSGIRNADGDLMQFGPGGTLIPYDEGGGTGNLINVSGGDGLDLNTVANLLSPTQRILFTSLVHFDVNDRLRVFGEGWFSNTRGTRLADQPVYNNWLFGDAGDPDGNIPVSIDNPFLPAESRALILENLVAAGADPSTFYLTRANTDLVSGRATGEVDLYRVVGGVEGDFELASRAFNWQVAFNYGRSKGVSREPSLVQQNFLNAIDVAIDPVTNTIVCAASLTPGGVVSAPVPTLSNTCAPLNLFGPDSPSQAARNYVTTIATTESTLSQRVITADISGSIFDLPAGPVQAVLGYENRRETSKFEPDQFFREAHGRAIPIDPISGEFETDELFTELLVPILSEDQGIPFVHRLQFEGALREVDHSVAGTDTTWTAGLRFAPVEDIQFRGNLTRAIRAPAITEAFNPESLAFDTANDPCDQRFINAGPNPAQRAANCQAAGIPPNFTSNIVDATAQISVSGNPDLLNEKADSEAYGFVLRPRWVPRLSLAVDWIKIDLKNAIVALDAEGTLEACYDSPSIVDNPLCEAIDRAPNGQVVFVRTGWANAGSMKFEGVTSELRYDFDLPSSYGRLGIALNYFNLRKLETRVGLGDLDTTHGEIGDAEHQGVVKLNYLNRNFTWQLQGHYFGSGVFDADELPGTRDFPKVPDWWLINTTVGYRFTDKLLTRLVVDNLFDKAPPFPVNAGGGTITYYKGILGRNYSLLLNYQF